MTISERWRSGSFPFDVSIRVAGGNPSCTDEGWLLAATPVFEKRNHSLELQAVVDSIGEILKENPKARLVRPEHWHVPVKRWFVGQGDPARAGEVLRGYKPTRFLLRCSVDKLSHEGDRLMWHLESQEFCALYQDLQGDFYEKAGFNFELDEDWEPHIVIATGIQSVNFEIHFEGLTIDLRRWVLADQEGRQLMVLDSRQESAAWCAL